MKSSLKLSTLFLLGTLSFGSYAFETPYYSMEGASPQDNQSAFPTTDEHVVVRTTVVPRKDEVSDTASVNQSATKRSDHYEKDMKKEEMPMMKRGHSPMCKTHKGMWLRPRDEGYTNCMNMPDTERK